jgi:hypothetical protein
MNTFNEVSRLIMHCSVFVKSENGVVRFGGGRRRVAVGG